MKDPWIIVGHGYEELKLYMEPLSDYKDSGQTDFMASMVTPGDGDPGLADRPETGGNVPVSPLGYKRSELEGWLLFHQAFLETRCNALGSLYPNVLTSVSENPLPLPSLPS